MLVPMEKRVMKVQMATNPRENLDPPENRANREKLVLRDNQEPTETLEPKENKDLTEKPELKVRLVLMAKMETKETKELKEKKVLVDPRESLVMMELMVSKETLETKAQKDYRELRAFRALKELKDQSVFPESKGSGDSKE